jgi:hypothetical protein
MDCVLDLVARLLRGRRVIGEDFGTLQLENVGGRVDTLAIVLASVQIDDNFHRSGKHPSKRCCLAHMRANVIIISSWVT